MKPVIHPVVIVLLLLPIIAVGIVLVIRRTAAHRLLVPALTLSGIATALTAAFFAFTSASVPIAPYELRQGAWWPIVGQVLLALYIGFGIGVIIAALIGLPFHLLAHRKRA
jgi:hypothetical protein